MAQHLRTWRVCFAMCLAFGAVFLAEPMSAAGAAGRGPARPQRLLVLSLPGVTWSDLEGASLPTLDQLLDESAVADLVTRADRQPASLGAAYVTIGAGTRSGSAPTDGDGLGVAERFGNSTAADAYHQRTGRSPGPGIVQLGIAQITATNDGLLFDAHVGDLGDTLRDAGFARAVIANADHDQPDAAPGLDLQFERPAVSALMGSRGIVREGDVGPVLLQRDGSAPFGVRLDQRVVERDFTRVWKSHSVVLVEGSDLERADLYGTYATPAQAEQLRAGALRETDALVRSLLRHVDPERDGVMVLGPTSRAGDRSLTVAALRAPGLDPGLLRSATTRRAGFVALADVAPTILDTLGIGVPASMEGRPMRLAAPGGSPADRRAFLIQANDDGLQRDKLVKPVTNVVAWSTIALALGTVLLLGRASWAPRALRAAALTLLGFLLATFVVVPLHIAQHGGSNAFWVFTVAFAIAFALSCRVVGSRRSADPLILALSVVVVVLTVDNLTRDHLEFNAVFGYSATVGIRLAGNSNSAFSILGASAVVLAALVAWRIGGSRGIKVGLALLALVLVAFTPPFFGQDFGGTIAAAPAFLVMAWMLLGRRIRLRTGFVFALVLVVSGLIVGFIDVLRPADQRTHVGRFFAQVGNQGWSGFATVLQRKGTENASTLGQSISVVVIVVVVATMVTLWLRSPRLLPAVVVAIPTLRAAAVSVSVLAVLGYALNDSGIAIPALMCAVVAAAVAYLVSVASTATSEPEDGPVPGPVASSDVNRPVPW